MLQIRKAKEGNLKKFIAWFAIATIFAAFVPALATAPQEKVQVIIVFKEKPNAALITGLGGEVITTYNIIPGLAARVPIGVFEELGKNPAVAYIEPDVVVYALEQQVPWGISRIGAPSAWSSSTGAGVKVAILDTGIQYDHPDLAANIKGGISVVGETYSTDPADWNDGHGHGTHVAGIVAAVNNDVGLVGSAPDAWLYGVKVLFDNGEGYISDVIEGIDWSVQNGIQVLNMSLGTDVDVSAFEDACDRAYEAGLLLVAAAGNEGDGNSDTTELSYPAAYDSVIAVAATNSNDQAPSWSNSGPFVELAAPGVSIYSTYKGSTYVTMSGTSMAAPHVSGTTALVWARNPSLTNVQVRSILQQTAEDLGFTGRDTVYGYGLVRADEAVQTNILTLRPNASGEYTEYTTVFRAAEHWDAVNDVAPDEDNTYIETKTAGHRDTFNLENSGLPDVPILNVRAYARARKTTGAATKINLMIRTYDNDNLSEDMTLTSSYATYHRDWAVNPYTGGSWTISEVNSLQAGVRSASSRNHRVTQVYVDVTYKLPTFGVEVSISPSYQSAPPGTALEYTVSVINQGNVTDNYNLTVSDNAGWGPIITPSSLSVFPGGFEEAILEVTVPENAENSDGDKILVVARSQTDNTVSAENSCVALAVIRGVTVSALNENWVVASYSPDVLNYAVAVTGAGNAIYIANSATSGYPSYPSYFWRYNPSDNTWNNLAVPSGLLWKPGKPDSGEGAFKNGTSLAWDNGDYIYTLFGASYADGDQGYYRHYFYRYSIPNDNWEQLENTPNPKGQGAGDAITWVPGNVLGTETDWIYAVVGSKVGKHGTTFCRYNIDNNSWEVLSYNPGWTGGADDGSSLVWAGGDYLYALQGEWHETDGSKNRSFASFNLTDNTWHDLAPIPEEGGVGDGGSLVWVGGSYSNNVYALGGGSALENPGENFYYYNILGNSWTKLSDLPYGITNQNGPRLGYANENIYCWRGYYNASEGDPDVLWAYAVPGAEPENFLFAGWNLVSFPVASENDTPDNIFENQTYFIWKWDAENKKYVSPLPNVPVELGVGYWIWVDHDKTVTTSGIPVDNYLIDLITGWNLVGFPVTNDNTTPDNIFAGQTYYIWKWDAVEKKYISPPSNQPVELGVGYWIWVDHDKTVTVPL